MSRQYVIVVAPPDAPPVEHRVAHLPVSIGRDASNDVRVVSQYVSGFHAKVEEIKGRVYVRDLGSRNGTQVNSGDGGKTRVQPHTLFDLAQSNSEFFLGSSVRVQVLDEDAAAWRGSRGAPRPKEDSFLRDEGPRGHIAGGQVASLPDLGGDRPRGGWDAPDPRPQPQHDFGGGPLSLPPIPGEGLHGRPAERRPPTVPPGRFDGGNFDPPPPPRVDERYPAQRSFEPVQGNYGSVPVPGNLSTGNFNLSMESLALQGLRELAGSLLPSQSLNTQGDVARLITRLHDAVDVLCRAFIPLRRNYLKFVSSMDLQKSAHFAQANAVLDMARDPSAVAAALLDFRETAPEASKALEAALRELSDHQVAMLDGVMQGVRAMLDELSPGAIQDAAEQKRGSSLRIGGRQKEAWDEYCERYDRLSAESEAFSRIFGQEFAHAYRRYRRRQG